MDALPLPSSTRRLVSRIAATAHPDDLFPPPDQISTAFVVTLVDSLHVVVRSLTLYRLSGDDYL